MKNKCMPSIFAVAVVTSLTLLLCLLLFSNFVKDDYPFSYYWYSPCSRRHFKSTQQIEASSSFTSSSSSSSSSSPSSSSFWKNDDTDDDDAALRKFAATDAPGVLNIHVVPHTHDDVGWRKTVEQYYYGWNTSIDTRGSVHAIISTVLHALLQNPARTFSYTESKFLNLWWNEQSNDDSIRDSLRQVIAQEQFQIVNGGWCMHDEASSHYIGMMDQTTTGHAFLKETLGIVPRTAWQLDPFGHSQTQASLMTARAGFDALYFGRIDYQDMALRKQTQDCEGLWDTSPPSSSSFSSSSLSEDRPKQDTNVTTTTATTTDDEQQQQHEAIFWGLTGSYRGNYGPPDDSFCFDVLCPDTEPLVGANTSRLVQRMEMLVKNDIRFQAQQTRGQHIMLTMGTDFTYQNAFIDFVNLDLMISSLENFQKWDMLNISDILGPRFHRINVFYSTPDYYTAMKYQETVKARNHKNSRQEQEKQNSDSAGNSTIVSTTTTNGSMWSIKRRDDDFFPYADCPHCFWTGYFTSRTAFKRFERVASAFLQAARQMESLHILSNITNTRRSGNQSRPLWTLEDALGVAQHHDAVSGTAKQHVADDYSKRLQMGMAEASAFFARALRTTMLKKTNTATSFLDNLSFCQLLNETKCPVSEAATKPNMTNYLYVIVYNPLGVERSTNVQLPVSSQGTYVVEALAKRGNRTMSPFIISTVCPTLANCVFNRDKSMMQKDSQHDETKYVLNFEAGPIPPVGAAAFRLIKVSNDTAHDGVDDDITSSMKAKIASTARHLVTNDDDLVNVSNGILNVTFDKLTGAMKRIASHEVEMDIEQVWGYYVPFDSEFDVDANAQENSGAYIFRPQTPNQKLITVEPAPSGARFVNITVGIEVHVSFDNAPWIKQVTRILNGQPWVEIGYQVGPVPIEQGRGKEVVTRFVTSSIQNEGIFYTDSNGREFLQRQRDFRPSWPFVVHEPIAGNYYPVNAAIYIQDMNASLAILVDRSRGGASIMDGSLEVMVQRRTVADDHRGVDEPMNETCGGMTAYPPYGRAERLGEGVTVRGTHRIMVGRGSSGARLARSAMDSIFAEPLIFVASAPSDTHVSFRWPSFSALALPLPPNVMLITLLRLPNRDQPTLLVRLGHQYGMDEDEVLSKPVKVDMSLLLSAHFNVDKMTEMTLTGNQEWKAYIARRFNWTGTPEKDHGQDVLGDTTITLNPMEIRTFEVLVSAK